MKNHILQDITRKYKQTINYRPWSKNIIGFKNSIIDLGVELNDNRVFTLLLDVFKCNLKEFSTKSNSSAWVSGRPGDACTVVINIVHVAYVLGNVRSFSASIHQEVSSARFLPPPPPSFPFFSLH